MTETEPSYTIESGCYNTVLVRRINELLYESMRRIPTPTWDEQDLGLADALLKTLPEEAIDHTLSSFDAKPLEGEKLHAGVMPLKEAPPFLAGSTDVSNVSRTVPTGQIFTCCVPVGVPGHTWQTVVSVGSNIGRKGMMYAAKVIADTAMVLFTQPEEIEQIQTDFRNSVQSNV